MRTEAEEKMLKQKIKINSYDVGENGEIKVSALMKYMQELAVSDIAGTGATYEKMRADDMVFVIIRFGINFSQPVRKYDEIEILTVNNRIEGVVFVREYLFYRGGLPVAEATTHWVLMSYSRRMPLRPSALNYPCDPVGMDIKGVELLRRTDIDTSDPSAAEPYTVRWSALDENRHLNNTVYARWAADLTGEDYARSHRLRSLLVEYKKELPLGAEAELQYTLEADTLYLRGTSEGRDSFLMRCEYDPI